MSSNSNPRKRRITQACKPCGSRKVKCDGGIPSCGRCTSDNVRCSYGVSKRNTRLTHLSPFAPLPARSPESPSPVPLRVPQKERMHCSEPTAPVIPSAAASCPPNVTIVPSHISNRLFQAYFRCIHPIWPILYKPLYNSLDHEQLLDVLPRPLVYAILSLAVLIQEFEIDHMSKHDEAKQFFDEALKALKDIEPSQKTNSLGEVKSSITACQVYTILALQQHSIGAFSQAGILCAIAASMAIDQSLHRISSTDNHVEAQVKSRLWWNIYVLEKMLSFEMSRPVLLRAEEAETPFPSLEESDEYELYSESVRAETIVEHRRHHLLRNRTISGLHTSIRIAMIMENVSRQIYSIAARQRIRNDPEAGEEVRLRLWAELQEYETAMDLSPLKLDTSGNSESIPLTVTNYVYMWLTTILLHRPFIENWQQTGSITATSTLQSNPYNICLFAANQICSTIETYTRYMCGLPCDLIFPIYAAANILLQRWREFGGEDALIRQRLELCVKWLNGLGKSWKGAQSRQEMLSESINLTSQNAQTQGVGPQTTPTLDTNELINLFDDCSNFTLLSMNDNFDLEYLGWVNSLGNPGPVDQ